ncbi:MAG TPA: Zn-ribbon domain-containing OB-fold protein [Acidimicrobiales bacterium]|nr:Zn-ribbon domain-containing OB-fold protein [Acidimicrobiales bacterium]
MADRPVPLPDNVSRSYWEAAGRGELLFQECPQCGQRQLYPRALCTGCAGTPVWRAASGRGTVHTFTVIRQNWAEPFREMLPYVVAMVELAEGPRLMSNVTDCAPEDVHIGMPVEAWFLPVEDGVAVPMFRPLSA